MEPRRRFLRWLLFSALGTGILLAVGGLSKPAPVNVKVVYFMMAKYVSTSVEHFVLQSPASLRDLLNAVVKRHPSFAGMMPTMQVVLDGVPAQPTAPLRDGDEVDFIPMTAGG